MLIAVAHAAGAEAARDILHRATKRSGRPHDLAVTDHAVLAAWQSSAPIRFKGGVVVEGCLDGDSYPDGIASQDFLSWLPRARGDFAAMAAVQRGVAVASGPVGGHRPIFVVRNKDWSAASTRVRALLDLMDERPALDLDYLSAATLADYPVSPAATPYEGVSHVPMGEAWLLRPGSNTERFPIALNPPREPAQGDDAALATVLREEVERSVERSTRGASKVAVMLSGGVDSSSVLVTLEDLHRRGRVSAETDAYAWEFETPDPGDDRPYRRAVEQRVGKLSRPVVPATAGPFVRRAMVLDGAPCVDIPCALWLALDDAAYRAGTDRLLTGIGGDNVFEGDPRLFGELALRGHPLRALRNAVTLKGMGTSTVGWRVRELVLRPLVRSLTPPRLRAAYRRRQRRRRFDWMGARFDAWLESRSSTATAELTLDSSPAERYAWLSRIPFMADQALIRSQQEEVMRCRRADPLFDDDLMRVIATIPPLSLLSGGFARGLLRRAMSDLLPPEVKTRRNKAYMEPALAQMLRAAGGFEGLEDLAKMRRLSDLGLVNPKPFRAHFDRVARQPLEPFWWSVWPALAVEEFLRQYEDGWTS